MAKQDQKKKKTTEVEKTKQPKKPVKKMNLYKSNKDLAKENKENRENAATKNGAKGGKKSAAAKKAGQKKKALKEHTAPPVPSQKATKLQKLKGYKVKIEKKGDPFENAMFLVQVENMKKLSAIEKNTRQTKAEKIKQSADKKDVAPVAAPVVADFDKAIKIAYNSVHDSVKQIVTEDYKIPTDAEMKVLFKKALRDENVPEELDQSIWPNNLTQLGRRISGFISTLVKKHQVLPVIDSYLEKYKMDQEIKNFFDLPTNHETWVEVFKVLHHILIKKKDVGTPLSKKELDLDEQTTTLFKKLWKNYRQNDTQNSAFDGDLTMCLALKNKKEWYLEPIVVKAQVFNEAKKEKGKMFDETSFEFPHKIPDSDSESDDSISSFGGDLGLILDDEEMESDEEEDVDSQQTLLGSDDESDDDFLNESPFTSTEKAQKQHEMEEEDFLNESPCSSTKKSEEKAQGKKGKNGTKKRKEPDVADTTRPARKKNKPNRYN